MSHFGKYIENLLPKLRKKKKTRQDALLTESCQKNEKLPKRCFFFSVFNIGYGNLEPMRLG